MTTDLRPARTAFSVFDADAIITLGDGSAPFAAKVQRVGLSSSRPSIVMDQEVANRPRFRVWRAEVPKLLIGSTIQVLTGPDAGTVTVDRVDDSDPELLEAMVN